MMVMTFVLLAQMGLGMQLMICQVRPDAPNRSVTFTTAALPHPNTSSSNVSSPRMPADALEWESSTRQNGKDKLKVDHTRKPNAQP